MENKKLTAVETLIKNLEDSGIHLMSDEKEMCLKALELEKEQIIDAHHSGQLSIIDVCLEEGIIKDAPPIDDKEDSEQYYQNTYGNKESN